MTDVPSLDYAAHLFNERSVTSVTANTRADGTELLALAEQIPLRPSVVRYPFGAVDRALVDLAADRVDGVAVVDVAPGDGSYGRTGVSVTSEKYSSPSRVSIST